MMRHSHYMRIALQEAMLAGNKNEIPVGAVFVKDGEILSQNHNRRNETNDPTAHAEMLVLRDAAEKLGDWRLTGSTLYVTLEPCSMCAGAIALARVETLVFGAPDPDAGAAGSVYNILEDGKLNFRSVVIGGILEEECRDILLQFFNGLR